LYQAIFLAFKHWLCSSQPAGIYPLWHAAPSKSTLASAFPKAPEDQDYLKCSLEVDSFLRKDWI